MELLTLADLNTALAVIGGFLVYGMVDFLARKYSDQTRIKKLEKQVKRLQYKVTLLESSHQDAPIPIWLKDNFGVMLALNPAYEKTFLLPRNLTAEDYLNKTDEVVWPEDIADEYRKNDLMVARTNTVWKGYETIIDHQGKETQWQVIKYPRTAAGITIGIAGIAIPPP